MSVQLFIRVVETASFSKAAAELAITQPTATKAVAAMEARLGARLLHRSTRGVTATEIGSLYYDKCLVIAREIDAADNLAALLQSQVAGRLRLSTSVAFGRRVLTPIVLRYMNINRAVAIDLSFDDRYVNLVEQGVDLAVRMGRLADSSLGASHLGLNPWMMVASPKYLKELGTPKKPNDIKKHACLIYSTVQGDDRWSFTDSKSSAVAAQVSIAVKGPLRSNNLSALLSACRAGMGLAILPRYVASQSVQEGILNELLPGYALPSQEVHAVFPSPKLVPSKVMHFIHYLQSEMAGDWWLAARK